eukprot:TRINITY_DN894_c0_g2_i1.p1 TRINITY_DN894_c0_g2~~TRINITY_DN894_c0_g2_i1.p1  ORF type:complete len:499 (-),score=128.92 TRINITY_DN894_c0_g2_i1:212-1675(-)
MEESDDETVASDISEVKKLQKSVKTVDSDGWGHSESFLESLKANQTKKRSETLRQFAEFKAELCKHTDAATLRSCQSFKDDVSSRQKEFDTVFAQELADDALVGVPLARFAEISELIQSWAPQATALAARLDTQLHDLEVQRKQSLEQLLRSLHESLSKLQHPVEHDIVAPIKDEIEEYNLCAVKNRTFRAQLKCRFLKDEAVRRHGLASRLTARLAAAKRVQHDHAVATAQQTLASAAFLDPPERRMVLTAPTAAHLEFVEALDAQMKLLRDLVPPTVSLEAVADWSDRLAKIVEQQSSLYTLTNESLATIQTRLEEQTALLVSNLRAAMSELGVESADAQKAVADAVAAAGRKRDVDCRATSDGVRLAFAAVEKFARANVDKLTGVVTGAAKVYTAHAARLAELRDSFDTVDRSARAALEVQIKPQQDQLFELLGVIKASEDKDSMTQNTTTANSLLRSLETGMPLAVAFVSSCACCGVLVSVGR